MLPLCSTLQKYSLCIFNSVFVLTGVLLIYVGLSGKFQAEQYGPVVDNSCYTLVPNLIILLGCFVFLVAFLGCCGSLTENHCMTLTFSVMMVVIFLVEVAIVMFAYWVFTQVTDIMTERLTDSMVHYNSTEGITGIWDDLQSRLSCCGTRSVSDWARVYPNGHLPNSCCKPPVDDVCTVISPTIYNKPCLDAIVDEFKDFGSLFIHAGIVIAVLQLLNVVFACNLAHSIRKVHQTTIKNLELIQSSRLLNRNQLNAPLRYVTKPALSRYL